MVTSLSVPQQREQIFVPLAGQKRFGLRFSQTGQAISILYVAPSRTAFLIWRMRSCVLWRCSWRRLEFSELCPLRRGVRDCRPSVGPETDAARREARATSGARSQPLAT